MIQSLLINEDINYQDHFKWHYCLIVMKKIRKHINNTFKDQEVEKENNTQKMRVVGVKQPVPKWNKFKWKVVAKYATTTKHGMVI